MKLVVRRQLLKHLPINIVANYTKLANDITQQLEEHITVVNNYFDGNRERMKTKVVDHLHQLPLTKLKKCARQFGYRSEDQRKHDMIQRMAFDINSIVDTMLDDDVLQIVSMDLGVKNMAWSFMKANPMSSEINLLTAEVRNLQEATQYPRNWLEIYATQSVQLVQHINTQVAQHKITDNIDYVLEQQMMTFNQKCAIIECQLHVLLRPRVYSVSPKVVAYFFGTRKSAAAGVGSDDQLQPKLLNYGGLFKKELTVQVIQRMLDLQLIKTNSDTLLYWNTLSKKDDMADSILTGIYYLHRKRRLALFVMEVLLLEQQKGVAA